MVLGEGWAGADGWNFAVGVPEGWMRDHIRLEKTDPSRSRLMASPAGTWWVAERDLSATERKLEIFSCFQAAGLTDTAIVKLYNPFRDDLMLVLYRDDRAFAPHEAGLLELLYPHLAGAAATRRALALVTGAAAAASAPAVTIAFPAGSVTIDGPAQRYVERCIGPVDAAGWGRVRSAILVAARRFSLAHVGGRSQTLWPGLRVDFAVVPPKPGETMRLVGLLVDERGAHAGPVRVPEPVAPLVEARLSPRQLEVARDFAAGMDVPGIAESRRLSVDTVRTHLRIAYRKLDVRSRSELARALSGEEG
jgi:DNA-binding CsgD family transcriptional regulator